MKIFVNKDIKNFFITITILVFVYVLSAIFVIWNSFSKEILLLFFLSAILTAAIFFVCFRYFMDQNRIIEKAASKITEYLSGNKNARIDCMNEGELYKLFHEVNTLASVLDAHAENEFKSKEFLKDTISDISHQIKTPIAALSIYNELIQNEAENQPEIKKLAAFSEREIDRIEILVQNLLKIAKFDAGTIVINKSIENVSEIMNEVKEHFAFRADSEKKEIKLSGDKNLSLLCDRNWLIEAIENIVKNALDHTDAGGQINIEWKRFASFVQIIVKDNGYGIHPEDLPHIFKRFYRSRFSKDIQGIGLGLSLANSIVKAHGGSIEAESEPGKGTTFIMNFLFTTKL